jgi:capsular polysaccharide biosynthesis protein
METHRVERDRELFGRAAVVVGVHGAALTNILFARPGTAVVEIVLDTTRHRDFM